MSDLPKAPNTPPNALDETPSDERLMQEYQLGNEQAFSILYARYSRKVYGYLLAKLKDPSKADDVFQATFLKLHRTRSRYDASFPFLPWLFTICRNVMIDELRSKKNEILSDEMDLLPALSPENNAIPALSLNGLPPEQRQAIELRYGKELSFDEIAKHLETSQENARQLISRGIRKLRTLLTASTKEKEEI